jgi:hypothetical protein
MVLFSGGVYDAKAVAGEQAEHRRSTIYAQQGQHLPAPQPGDITPVSRFQAVANTAPGRAALGPIA